MVYAFESVLTLLFVNPLLTAPNTGKLEYTLRYLEIPYQKQWLSAADITSTLGGLNLITPHDPAVEKYPCRCSSDFEGGLIETGNRYVPSYHLHEGWSEGRNAR